MLKTYWPLYERGKRKGIQEFASYSLWIDKLTTNGCSNSAHPEPVEGRRGVEQWLPEMEPGLFVLAASKVVT